MHDLQITAETREKALEEARRRLGLPPEALDIEWREEADEDLLAGAKPMVQASIAIRTDYVAGRIQEILVGLLEKMGIEAEVSIREEPEATLVKVEVPEPDLLIGHHGETLDSLQHLVVRMMGVGGREMPLVLIDVGSYRLRRIERLRKVCQTLADMVLSEGQEEQLDPMSSTDRKIVHTIIKGIEGVKSYSRGEEYSRHVVIAPE